MPPCIDACLVECGDRRQRVIAPRSYRSKTCKNRCKGFGGMTARRGQLELRRTSTRVPRCKRASLLSTTCISVINEVKKAYGSRHPSALGCFVSEGPVERNPTGVSSRGTWKSSPPQAGWVHTLAGPGTSDDPGRAMRRCLESGRLPSGIPQGGQRRDHRSKARHGPHHCGPLREPFVGQHPWSPLRPTLSPVGSQARGKSSVTRGKSSVVGPSFPDTAFLGATAARAVSR